MRYAGILALAFLSACGGGGVLTPDLGAVVEVSYGDTAGYAGLTYLDDGPARIVLASWLEDFPNAEYRAHVLRHEMYHAVTRFKTHSENPSCVSCDNRSPYEGTLAMPCPVERDEMRASDPIRVRWVGHTEELYESARWWNESILAVVIEVVED